MMVLSVSSRNTTGPAGYYTESGSSIFLWKAHLVAAVYSLRKRKSRKEFEFSLDTWVQIQMCNAEMAARAVFSGLD
jgi:hypothetical protein